MALAALASTLAATLLACGPQDAPSPGGKSETESQQLGWLNGLAGETAVDLRHIAPSIADRLYDEQGQPRPEGRQLNLALRQIETSGGLLEREQPNSDAWRLLPAPREKRPLKVLSAPGCNFLSWVTVDDTGTQVAAGSGCGRQPVIVWSGTRTRRVQLPPGIVVASDFTGDHALMLALSRARDGATVLYKYDSQGDRLSLVARWDGMIARHGCPGLQAGDDHLAFIADEAQDPKGSALMLVGPRGEASRLMGLSGDSYRSAKCALIGSGPTATVLIWRNPPPASARAVSWLEERFVWAGGKLQGPESTRLLSPDGDNLWVTGASPDGSTVALAELFPAQSPGLQRLLVSADGRHLAQLSGAGWTGVLINDAIPLSRGTIALISGAKVMVVTPTSVCVTSLDADLWRTGVFSSFATYDRRGPIAAVVGPSGRIFILKLDC
jgi:hypothetical protein